MTRVFLLFGSTLEQLAGVVLMGAGMVCVSPRCKWPSPQVRLLGREQKGQQVHVHCSELGPGGTEALLREFF